MRSRSFLMLVAFASLLACESKDNPSPTAKVPRYMSESGPVATAVGPSAIPGFWTWFSNNSVRLHELSQTDSLEVLNEISYELSRIDHDLTFELGIRSTVMELVISANGYLEKFPLVEQTVSEAPQVNGWDIIAFRQPKPYADTAVYDGTSLSHSQVKFTIDEAKDRPGVVFYIQGLQSQVDPKIGAMFHLLDNLIGEYNTATKIGGIEFRQLSTAPPNALPFPRLKTALGL